ncbi:hypothetical protein P4909_17815 [Escherichia coli]
MLHPNCLPATSPEITEEDDDAEEADEEISSAADDDDAITFNDLLILLRSGKAEEYPGIIISLARSTVTCSR